MHAGRNRWLVSYADFIHPVVWNFCGCFMPSPRRPEKADAGGRFGRFRNSSLWDRPGLTRKQTKQDCRFFRSCMLQAPAILVDEEIVSAARIKEDLERVQRELELSLRVS